MITYRVYQNHQFIKEVEETSTLVDKLQPNTTYTFYVTSTDGIAESERSNVVEIKTGDIQVQSVELNVNQKTIEVDDTFKLEVKIIPENATDTNIQWESDNSNIATVENGLVRGISKGIANITATTINGKMATCKVAIDLATPKNLKAKEITTDSVTLVWE